MMVAASVPHTLSLRNCTAARKNSTGSLEPTAVSDHVGVATFHIAPDTNTGSSGFTNMARYRRPTQTVAVTTLSAILDQYNIDRVDLLKIDIEGAEYEAILGSRDAFKTHRIRRIALELHPKQIAARGHSTETIEAFLQSAGYKRSTESDNALWIVPSP